MSWNKYRRRHLPTSHLVKSSEEAVLRELFNRTQAILEASPPQPGAQGNSGDAARHHQGHHQEENGEPLPTHQIHFVDCVAKKGEDMKFEEGSSSKSQERYGTVGTYIMPAIFSFFKKVRNVHLPKVPVNFLIDATPRF